MCACVVSVTFREKTKWRKATQQLLLVRFSISSIQNEFGFAVKTAVLFLYVISTKIDVWKCGLICLYEGSGF